MSLLKELTDLAKKISESKYPDASVVFLAGSIVRGEGTPYSDLDLVVIFDKLAAAYRESFYFHSYPVEAFVHDPETLDYFFYEVDRPLGIPSLGQMVVEGIEVTKPNDLSQSLKQLAASVIALGPPKLSEVDIGKLRYNITNLVDDRQPLSKAEVVASGAGLYKALGGYYLRTNNLWSANGKSIPRMLEQADASLCLRFCTAFEDLFANGRPEMVISLAEALLRANGGFLFDGYRLNAPPEWRRPLT